MAGMEGGGHTRHFVAIICTLFHIHVGNTRPNRNTGEVDDESHTPSRAGGLRAAADRCVREGGGAMM